MKYAKDIKRTSLWFESNTQGYDGMTMGLDRCDNGEIRIVNTEFVNGKADMFDILVMPDWGAEDLHDFLNHLHSVYIRCLRLYKMKDHVANVDYPSFRDKLTELYLR